MIDFADRAPNVEDEPRELMLLLESRRLIDEARTLDEVKDIRDRAESLRLYLRQRGESFEIQNAAAEIKIRAERRAGELLHTMPMQRPGEYQRSHDATVEPKLSELGLTKSDSSRWQRIASIPEEDFEAHIHRAKANSKELTSAGMLRLAKNPESHGLREWTLDDYQEYLGSRIFAIYQRWPKEHITIMAYQLRSIADELIAKGELCE